MFVWILRQFKELRAILITKDTPKQLAAGFAIGVMLGIVPKGNLIAAIFAIILVATKANVATGTVTSILVTWAAKLLDPLSHRIGLFLLSSAGVQQFGKAFYKLPLVPWTSINNTVVLGSFLIACVLGYPAYRFSVPYFAKYLDWRLRRKESKGQHKQKAEDETKTVEDGSGGKVDELSVAAETALAAANVVHEPEGGTIATKVEDTAEDTQDRVPDQASQKSSDESSVELGAVDGHEPQTAIAGEDAVAASPVTLDSVTAGTAAASVTAESEEEVTASTSPIDDEPHVVPAFPASPALTASKNGDDRLPPETDQQVPLTASETARHSGILQHDAVQHDAAQYAAVQYEAVQYEAVQYEAVQYEAVQRESVQCDSDRNVGESALRSNDQEAAVESVELVGSYESEDVSSENVRSRESENVSSHESENVSDGPAAQEQETATSEHEEVKGRPRRRRIAYRATGPFRPLTVPPFHSIAVDSMDGTSDDSTTHRGEVA